MTNETNIAKLARPYADEPNSAKLARLYTEEGFTKEQAATEMINNNTPFFFAVRVLHAMK